MRESKAHDEGEGARGGERHEKEKEARKKRRGTRKRMGVKKGGRGRGKEGG